MYQASARYLLNDSAVSHQELFIIPVSDTLLKNPERGVLPQVFFCLFSRMVD